MISGIAADLNVKTIGHGFIGFLFAITGALAVLLNAASDAGIPAAIVQSWVFCVYALGGLATMALSLATRQPVALAWSIPGSVIAAASFHYLSFAEVVGAYVITAVLLMGMGWMKWTEQILVWIPKPVMMAMVAGIFFPFVSSAVVNGQKQPWLALAGVVVFFAVNVWPALSRRIPPLLLSAVAVILLGWQSMSWQGLDLAVARPLLVWPTFSLGSLSQLVLPLFLTILVIQTGQGTAILQTAGYITSPRKLTFWSGVVSLLQAPLGGSAAGVAGFGVAIFASKENGRQEQRYASAVVFGFLFVVFALAAPMAVRLIEVFPSGIFSVLSGLAILGVLEDSLREAFSGLQRWASTATFAVTVSNIHLFDIGSPFWGLLAGLLIVLIPAGHEPAHRQTRKG